MLYQIKKRSYRDLYINMKIKTDTDAIDYKNMKLITLPTTYPITCPVELVDKLGNVVMVFFMDRANKNKLNVLHNKTISKDRLSIIISVMITPTQNKMRI